MPERDGAAHGWREAILREFPPGAARLTLVADPDGLLLDTGLLAALEERGFELLPFEDPVAFRFAYESRYRDREDGGETAGLIVVRRGAISRGARSRTWARFPATCCGRGGGWRSASRTCSRA